MSRKTSLGSLVGPTSAHMRVTKSSSLGSVNSSDGPLDHHDILALTHSVRSFHDVLTTLEALFSVEGPERGEKLLTQCNFEMSVFSDGMCMML